MLKTDFRLGLKKLAFASRVSRTKIGKKYFYILRNYLVFVFTPIFKFFFMRKQMKKVVSENNFAKQIVYCLRESENRKQCIQNQARDWKF